MRIKVQVGQSSSLWGFLSLMYILTHDLPMNSWVEYFWRMLAGPINWAF
jgi:hypothetical protein